MVIHPEWLLKALGNFIYNPDLHMKKRKLEKTPQNINLIEEYTKSGILSNDLVIKMLEAVGYSSKEIQFLLGLSQELLLMSEFKFRPDWGLENDRFYMVPAMLRQNAKQKLRKKSSSERCYNVLISFTRYLPIGLYERIFGLMLSINQDFEGASMKPSVYKDLSRFFFREFPVFLVNERNKRRFRVSLPKARFGNSNSILNIVLILEELIGKLKSDALGKAFNPKIVFERMIEEDGVEEMIHCEWKDLYQSSLSKTKLVRCIESDGEEDLKPSKIFAPFDSVAELAVERVKQQQILDAEEAKAIKKGEVLPWEYDAFMAHSWGPNNQTHQKVIEIGKQLEERGVRIWIDDANLTEFVADDIVAGLRKSSAILVFITKNYLERINKPGANASREFRMASLKPGRTLVPIVLEKECLDPKEWFGSLGAFHLSDLLYIDFSSKEAEEKNFDRLIQRIEMLGGRKRRRNSFDTVINEEERE